MRILLVDNYDSYTYNLFQLLAAVAGSEPTVLANDDPRLAAVDQIAAQCVVISPGPGRPHRVTDLGWGWELLDRRRDLPVLGVCLGHQAIALHAGARVDQRRARHGQVDRVRHTGTGLFAGIPQGFAAVRYHSLQVTEPVPADLMVSARAADGTVMAVTHRRLPRWGVQFHPESIGTEHGARLVGNFLALARAVGPATATDTATVRPVTAGPRRAATASVTTRQPAPDPAAADPGWRCDVTVVDTEIDTEAAFLELYADAQYAYWLDGADVAAGRSRFSFLGDADGPLAEVLSYRVGSGRVEVRRPARPVEQEPGGILDVLRQRLARRRMPPAELPFDFAGGYVGYLGYEMKADCAPTTARRADTPDAVWIFADRLVAVDHLHRRTYLVALSVDDAGQRAARDWLAATATRLRVVPSSARPGPSGKSAAPPAGTDLRRWVTSARDRSHYLADVDAARTQLRRGESYEICLTNQLRLPPVADPLAYYQTLRRTNPAPYAAYLRLDDIAVASSSPERFLRIRPDGRVDSSPVKGTSARADDADEDDRLRRTLASSPKTRAENLMIVDLLRNDLGRVCEVGSVRVPRFLATETYSTLHQLVSTVEGRLRPSVGAVDCVRSCFPGGSMTGAPKLRTMEIIDRLEQRARGIYSGALGYFGLGGGADLSIVIRTAVLTGDGFTVGTGGAIVLDSDPADEYDETMLKARALLVAYRSATRSVQ
ncbi:MULTISPECIES: aminodeoxychorismate synthase component I [unclassified Solwaraspora]|uniref:aminodeoxychorismate synthase component I n=1 Tax=unclassified Solwaraspora TaxID=2627926 RepID=UPI00248C8DFC|nr:MULTISPECIES: aminodeoxychorismate synthase component I [unclassified Solwaraspora]WBB99978.1 aminodeoxychorismate synthase component I [Solwaraspora sp. WMMA2059]WBC21475.1 aminodeoxychorismate synthase component I [Solwaraspora sp. WMMA2080]WJK36446.1 aminodeoxychorismate synthase component I [Solwaraspora sp. WMMA2065]